MAKKKDEKDVLVVRDEKTGEISVVAGLNADGSPKRIPAKAENAQSFLQFDRHGDVLDNFFRNFFRQCREPSRFGFYRVAADQADKLLEVIKDLLKDPDGNKEMLAPHKVDTSGYEKKVQEEQSAEKFTQLGIPIDYSDMEKEYADAVITRAHFADYLLKKGYIKSRNEAFDRYIGSNGPCYVPRKKMPCAEAIRLIKNAGGVPILAHPVLYHLGKEPMNKLMDYLCDSGIVGLEAIYSTYTAGEEIQMKKLASERGLILSGGSDYHGANKPHIELGIGRGHLFVPYSLLDEIKKHRR